MSSEAPSPFVSACVGEGREYRRRTGRPSTPYSLAMPVEGQWQRANTPLRPRDKRLLAAVAVIAVVAVAAFAVFLLTHLSSPSASGCLEVKVPSTMGGASLKVCGADAHAFCRAQGRDARIAAACRRQGFGADLP